MPSTFPTSSDVIPSAGSTLSTPVTHSSLHNNLRDAVRATQDYVKAQVTTITANGWVTTARIRNLAVTNDKVHSVAISKLVGLPVFTSLRSLGALDVDGDARVDGYVRAGTASGNPGFRVQRYGGTLDGFGTATIAHNMGAASTGTGTRVIAANFFFKGNSGESVAMLGDNAIRIDGTSIHLSSGRPESANRPFVGSLMFTSDAVAW